MKAVLFRCLVVPGLVLLAVDTARPLDPGHFMVYDMPTQRQVERYGRVPGYLMTSDQLAEIAVEKFTGDSLRLLAILVEWEDRPRTYRRMQFDSLLFSRNLLPDGSLADYIHEVSYGQVTLTGEVFNWVNAGQYDPNYSFDTLFAILDQQIDYSRFDGNGDRKVDAICFIRSGNGEEDTLDPNDIWSFATLSEFGWGHFDSVKISHFHTCPETKPLRDPDNPTQFSGVSVINKVRIFAHELSHNLGLPDLYDIDDKLVTSTYSQGGDYNDHPLVDWCLMAYYGYGLLSLGSSIPSHMCAWAKMQMGWIDPIILVDSEYTDLVIYNIEATQDSSLYKIPINGNDAEYFLLEYRNPNSAGIFDKVDSDFSCWFWPDLSYGNDPMDRGLLISHVDDDVVPPSEEFSTNRGTPKYTHYTVMVEDAGYNPARDVSYNPEGHVTDSAQWWYPWETRKGALFSSAVDGQSEFGPYTVPSSEGYYGFSGIYVRVDSMVDDRLYMYINTAVPPCCLLRGDVDHSGELSTQDINYLIAYAWKGGPAPPCDEEADANGDGEVTPGDITFLIEHAWMQGPAPPPCSNE
jgi:M6 family metalloprotease-like protein